MTAVSLSILFGFSRFSPLETPRCPVPRRSLGLMGSRVRGGTPQPRGVSGVVALTPSAASPEMVAKPAVEGTLEEAPGDMQVEGLGQRQKSVPGFGPSCAREVMAEGRGDLGVGSRGAGRPPVFAVMRSLPSSLASSSLRLTGSEKLPDPLTLI